jgi:hypothetical protein
MAMNVQVSVLWAMTPCSDVVALKVEAARSSETVVHYNITRCHNLETMTLNNLYLRSIKYLLLCIFVNNRVYDKVALGLSATA